MDVQPGASLEADAIAELLPHRYPFLLVDRVLEWEAGKRIKAVKNVTVNEPHFPGHFPGYAIMPGVLIIEALAQTCGILMKLSIPAQMQGEGRMFLAGVTKARFKRQVIPGDTLILEAEFQRRHRMMAQLSCVAKVGEELACRAELLTALEA